MQDGHPSITPSVEVCALTCSSRDRLSIAADGGICKLGQCRITEYISGCRVHEILRGHGSIIVGEGVASLRRRRIVPQLAIASSARLAPWAANRPFPVICLTQALRVGDQRKP